MAVRYFGHTVAGLASDKSSVSPSANETGLIFVETDTDKKYQWDGDSWNELVGQGTGAGTLSLTADKKLYKGAGVYVNTDGHARAMSNHRDRHTAVISSDTGGKFSYAVFDSYNNRIVSIHSDSTNIQARVGEILADGSIDWGTETAIQTHFGSSAAQATGHTFTGCFDSNVNKVVFYFTATDNNELHPLVLTVDPSDNSFTQNTIGDGSPNTDTAVLALGGAIADSYTAGCCFNANNNSHVVTAQRKAASGQETVVSLAGTLNSSGVFTWGSIVGMQGENTVTASQNQVKVVDLPNTNHVAVMWGDTDQHLYVNRATVDASSSPPSLTIGTQAEIVDDDGHTRFGADMAWDSTNSRGMVVSAHHDNTGSATRVHYRAFTVSSNEIALNTAEADVAASTYLHRPAIAFNADAGHFIIAAQDTNNYGLMYVATPNGSDETLSIGSSITFESDDIQPFYPVDVVGPRNIVAVYCSAGWGNIRGVLLHYTTNASKNVEGTFLQDVTNDFDGDGSYATSSASAQGTPIQCIGVSSADYADNATNCSIITAGGKVTGLSGLVKGTSYYLNKDGGWTLNAPLSAGASDLRIGVALSATEMLIVNDLISD